MNNEERKIPSICNLLISMSGLYYYYFRINYLGIPSIIKTQLMRIMCLFEIVKGSCAYAKSFTNDISLNLFRKWDTNRKNCLAIVAIAKNERDYLREWVAFHKVVGIDRIYLYDNGSTDNMLETINDFISEGYVIVNSIRGRSKQNIAYNDALKRYGKDCKFMAFIDCDEYLFPQEPDNNIIDIINILFKDKKMAGGVGVNWRMYGSSGYEGKPQGLCIDNYIWRAETINGRGNECIKSIVKPECVKVFKHSHFPIFKFGWCNINQRGEPIPGWTNIASDVDALRINHYFTKSKEEWIKRRSLGKVTGLGERSIEEFYLHDNNDVKDTCANFYSYRVQKVMGSNMN